MHNRGFIFWGVGLVTAGAVALAVQQDYIDRTLVADAWRFWPLILVAIGFSIVVARTQFAVLGTLVAGLTAGLIVGALLSSGPASFGCGGAEPASLQTETGQFGPSASVRLDFNCGQLEVGTTSSSAWKVRSGQTDGQPARVSADADRLEVTSRADPGFMRFGRQHWIVDLPAGVAYDVLRIDANAAEATLDLANARLDALRTSINAGSMLITLSGSRVEGLDVGVNAGSASLILDGAADVSGKLHVNAGAIQVCTADEVAIRITLTDTNAFGDNLADSGLERSGDTWSTAGWESAELLVELTVSGNAGSFDLNPEGGCS